MTTDPTPTPGSDEAIERGCTCPRRYTGWLDAQGRVLYVHDGDCPLHGISREENDNDA